MKEITEVRLIVDSVIQLWGCFLLGGTGVVSNALNIAVFWRLGFRETANISLMLIAVIDCVKCSVSFLYRGYGLAGLFDVVLEVNWTRVTYLLNAHVQNLGVPMVSVVTMYVTVERCVCMCLPLKVKSILTTKVTVISLISLITLSGGHHLSHLYDVLCHVVLRPHFQPNSSSIHANRLLHSKHSHCGLYQCHLHVLELHGLRRHKPYVPSSLLSNFKNMQRSDRNISAAQR